MFRTKFILIFTVVLSLLGCATVPPYKAYQGEKKLSDLAIIQCDSEHAHKIFVALDERVYISKIDDKSTFNLMHALTANQEYPEQASVEHGRRYLEVRYQGHSGYTKMDLWFDAEAGKTYIVRKAVEGRNIRFWIEEKESGKVVGGIRGGEPKPE